ncbi:MAG: hypothetical protein IPM53_13180 [Anaerolineaceae bacterium]|nr:hypothetical protein [Anaerolineaceae bacterium]
MSQSRLLIVMSDLAWTSAALHLACAMSRRRQTDIVLLKMVPVRHPALLGTEAGALDFTQDDADVLKDMTATAEDYGVCLQIQVCPYANYWHALVGAAEALGVTAVIAHISPTTLPYWHHVRRWLLNRQLARQNQLLLTLDDLIPSLTWTPSLTLQHDLAVKLDRHQIHLTSSAMRNWNK